MRFFTNYYKAKALAEKRGLVEREYGDTGYMLIDEPISYCEWNRTGSRDDEPEIVCYYSWKLTEKGLRPIKRYKNGELERLKAIIRYHLGVCL